MRSSYCCCCSCVAVIVIVKKNCNCKWIKSKEATKVSKQPHPQGSQRPTLNSQHGLINGQCKTFAQMYIDEDSEESSPFVMLTSPTKSWVSVQCKQWVHPHHLANILTIPTIPTSQHPNIHRHTSLNFAFFLLFAVHTQSNCKKKRSW